MRHGGGEPKRERNRALPKGKGWHPYTRGREWSLVFEFPLSYLTPSPYYGICRGEGGTRY